MVPIDVYDFMEACTALKRAHAAFGRCGIDLPTEVEVTPSSLRLVEAVTGKPMTPRERFTISGEVSSYQVKHLGVTFWAAVR